jgi:hypothetical protein
MAFDDVMHEAGCDHEHTARQQCNGPPAEARRIASRRAVEEQQAARPAYPDDPSFPLWLSTPRIGVFLELLPGFAVAVVWLGSRTEDVHYHDFWGLHLLALMPPLGWIWRGLMGCSVAPVVWIARLMLLTLAAGFWAHAGGHGIVMIDDCCLIPDETVRW